MRPALPLEAEEFLSWLAVERGRSANTLAAYRRDLTAYMGFLRDRDLDLSGATEAVVEDWLALQRDAGRAPASVARALVAIKAVHQFLEDEGLTPNPVGDVERPRVPAGLPKALSEAEVAALLAVTGDDAAARRDRAILEVLYGCGLRVSELVGLSLADLDLDAGLLRAFGKGSKERVVPVGRVARGALGSWLAPGGRPTVVPERWARRGDAEAVFLNARGGRLTRQGAWRVVHRHGERAGLVGHLTPEMLRHSCAAHMLARGADTRVVEELLGHAAADVGAVSLERLRQVYEAAHPRAGDPRAGARG